MCLLARYLENNGIPTLVIGSAMDIIEHCRVPRYLHNDFPLGNPCGVPFEAQMQLEIMRLGLALLEKADKGGSIERSPFHWKDDLWRGDYAVVDDSNVEELRLRGERRRQQQIEDKAAGNSRSAMISDT